MYSMQPAYFCAHGAVLFSAEVFEHRQFNNKYHFAYTQPRRNILYAQAHRIFLALLCAERYRYGYNVEHKAFRWVRRTAERNSFQLFYIK